MKTKFLKADDLLRQIARWRLKSDKIVFTNGCFDILHSGHINTLNSAKALGDRLILGLNSDASVKRLKGKERPINSENSRAHVLEALACVDAVIIFEEDTPLELIKLIQPDVLAKGGDWKAEQIIGSDVVLSKGGEVHSLPYVQGYSTSEIIDKIRKL